MPQVWTFDRPGSTLWLPADAVGALLDVAAEPDSSDALLRAVQAVVPADYLSLVRLDRDVPDLVRGSAREPGDAGVVARCFDLYRRHYYRRDAVLPLAAELARRPGRDTVVLHCRASDLPDARWRSDIYERERLTDRLTLMHAPPSGQPQLIHVYRSDRLGPLRADELDRLLGLAPLLGRAHAAGWRERSGAGDRAARVRDHERQLARLAPLLSPRERAVCARIAQGLSADGIAADLGVAPSTVLTLRKRAYVKLAQAGLPAERQGLARLLH